MEQTLRVNTAIELLTKIPPGEAVSALMARFGISSRQAHRYVQRAQATQRPLSAPEVKQVFTVKLPLGLIREVRTTARKSNQRISDLTAKALWAFLQKRRDG